MKTKVRCHRIVEDDDRDIILFQPKPDPKDETGGQSDPYRFQLVVAPGQARWFKSGKFYEVQFKETDPPAEPAVPPAVSNN